MRGDRLIALLLTLQARGRTTADDLAARLEVSTRTVYRDIAALAAAGVPVVTQPGPEGGVRLLEGWRTDLTGLTETEVDALFSPATGSDLRRALAKLAASLPGEPGRRAALASERVLVDWAGWSARATPAPPHLAAVQDALFSDRRLRLRYRRAEERASHVTVAPLGLVLKSGAWYLLADAPAGRRVYRVSRIEDAEVLDGTFERPAGFHLERAWGERAGEFSAARDRYRVRVATSAMPLLVRVAGDRMVAHDGEEAELAFAAPEAAAAFLASFGSQVEVVEPAEVRAALARRGRELVDLYG